MISESVLNSPALVQLRDFLDQWTIKQKVLFLVINGLAVLLLDYVRMLLLRRKMVRNSTISVDVTSKTMLRVAATWAVPTSNHRKHTSSPRYQAMGIL